MQNFTSIHFVHILLSHLSDKEMEHRTVGDLLQDNLFTIHQVNVNDHGIMACKIWYDRNSYKPVSLRWTSSYTYFGRARCTQQKRIPCTATYTQYIKVHRHPIPVNFLHLPLKSTEYLNNNELA